MKFLIVDDNPGDRELVVRHLRREFPTAAFVEVFRRREFDEALAQGNIDVVFTDYQLHWTDGLWILRQCQEHLPHAPVIMITDTGGEEIAVEGMKAGADDYLVKPFSARELLARVEAHLNLYRLRREAEDKLAQASQRLQAHVDNSPLAAVQFDPDEAVGLDGALRKLADAPYGPVLLGLTAAGLVAYGLFCAAQARYRDV